MKSIFHIWDLGGGSSISLKAMERIGYTGDVAMRTMHDPYGFTKFYGRLSLYIDGQPYLELCAHYARHFSIIHVHGIYEILPKIRKLYPDKAIVMHYHGSDLLDCKDDDFRIMCEEHADVILYSTENMGEHLKYIQSASVYYVPNPIDTDIYRPIENKERVDEAVMFTMRYLNLQAVKDYLAIHCPWKYSIHDREKLPIPFHQIPEFYSGFTSFIDVKIVNSEKTDDKPGRAMSNSGLQALACGLKVFNYNNDILMGLPEQHTMEYHADLMDRIYSDITKTRCVE